MARPVSLATLEASIRWQADQMGATLRHTSNDLAREINSSIQRLRTFVSDCGLPYYLKSKGGTLTVGPGTAIDGVTPNYGTLTLPTASGLSFRAIYGLDVRLPSNEFIALDVVPISARNDYGNTTGFPLACSVLDPGVLAIFPAPDAAYSYLLRYLPVSVDLALSDDTFDGQEGWERWIIWDVLHKILHRDSKPELIASVKQERAEIEREIRHEAARGQRSQPSRRRDTRGQRKRTEAIARWSWYRGV